MWPGTTADCERKLPKVVINSLAPLLGQSWGEAAIDRLFTVDDAVGELLGSCGGLPLSYVVRRLGDVLKANNLARIDDRQVPSQVAADELLVAVSEVLGSWRQLYLDPEKMLGHLVLDHGVEMYGRSDMDQMHRSHISLHGGQHA